MQLPKDTIANRIRYVVGGGEFKDTGGIARKGAINFDRGAPKQLLVATITVILLPLLFLPSSIGIVPLKYPELFETLSWSEKYWTCLSSNLISIIGGGLGGKGFPLDIPEPIGNSWRLLISAAYLGGTFVALWKIVAFITILRRNWSTYKARIING